MKNNIIVKLLFATYKRKMKKKLKPGPKPKPESEKAQKKTYSFSPDVVKVLEKEPYPGALINRLIKASDEYAKVHGSKV